MIVNLKKNGSLSYGEIYLPGRLKKEIIFSTNICHPSMANNELSGPVVLNKLLHYVKTNFSKLKFTYRFVLLPETIGSIAYLSKYKNYLKKNLI